MSTIQPNDEQNPTGPPDHPIRVWVNADKSFSPPKGIPDEVQRNETTQWSKKNDQQDPRTLQIELLLIYANRALIFRTAEGVPCALIPGESKNQSNFAFLHSREFAAFLRQEYYAQQGTFPKEAHLPIVCDLIDHRLSHRAGTSLPAALRVTRGEIEYGREPGQPPVCRQVLAVDLGQHPCAPSDAVLEIDADGWSINHSSGFAFIRPRGYRPLPLPEPAGPEALTELKDLLRVDDCDWQRVLTFLVKAMHPTGPYPILVIQGQPGSGKSLAAKILKSLLDPTAVTFQPFPSNPNTLLRHANQTWISAFDHVTTMPKQISTALCCLSSGASFNLAVHGSPINISLARPILLTVPTGASGAAWKPRGDLMDRMLTVTLPPLTAETTKPASEILKRFEQARSKILGALAQAVSVAIGRVDQIQLTSYPRNAEAVVWAVAAAPALNTTQESIQKALEQISQFQLPRDPLLQKLATLMETRDVWQGTATKLKLELDLSGAPNHLSRKLKEVQAPLQVQGIEIAFPPRQESGQTIRISKVNKTKLESASQSAADLPVAADDPTFILGTSRTVSRRIHRQNAEQKAGEAITLPLQPDRQDFLPADTTTALPAESAPVFRATELGGGDRSIRGSFYLGVKTASEMVTPICAAPQFERTTVLLRQSESIAEEMQEFAPIAQSRITIPEADRQIVSSQESQGETITLPLQPDRQDLTLADTSTAEPVPLPAAFGVITPAAGEQSVRRVPPPGVVSVGEMVTPICAGPQSECTTVRPSESEAIPEHMQELAPVAQGWIASQKPMSGQTPVHNAVGNAGVADLPLPVRHGHPAGQDSRTALIAVSPISAGPPLERNTDPLSKSEAIVESIQGLAAVEPDRDSFPAPP